MRCMVSGIVAANMSTVVSCILLVFPVLIVNFLQYPILIEKQGQISLL